MKIFIIHGSFGNPEGNWFPWLKNELERIGHEVYVPKFPVEDYDRFKRRVERGEVRESNIQTLKNWLTTFKVFQEKIDRSTIFVAHSLGPAFVLRVLERIDVKVRGCIFVSGFIGELRNPVINAVNKSFFRKPFDWRRIGQNCKVFHTIASDNDPYVQYRLLKSFSKKLNTPLIVIKGGEHLNEESGYKKFPEVLNMIKMLN
jgi:predicted alpha/beta hydrolase family esterase